MPEYVPLRLHITFLWLDRLPQEVELDRLHLSLEELADTIPAFLALLRRKWPQVDHRGSHEHRVTQQGLHSVVEIRELLLDAARVRPDVLLDGLGAHVRDLSLLDLTAQDFGDLFLSLALFMEVSKLFLLHLDGLLRVVHGENVRVNLHLDLLDAEVGRRHRVLDVQLVVELLEVSVEVLGQLAVVVDAEWLALDELAQSVERLLVEGRAAPIAQHVL